MKTFILILMSVCVTTQLYTANPIPNASFELWKTESYDYPTGYSYTSNPERFFYSQKTFNVTRTTEAHEGLYALRLMTDDFEGDVNFGFALNYPPNDNNPGGFAINELPTGIQGYYRYHPIGNDSAGIVVTLSKNGSSIGYYEFSLPAASMGYIGFDFDFNPLPVEIPDNIRIGFASSYNPSMQGNPGSTLYLDAIQLKGVGMQPALMNGGFEHWETKILHAPEVWNISGNITESYSLSAEAYEGSYALRLDTYLRGSVDTPEVRGRSALLGYWNEETWQPDGGMPLSGSEDTLVFYYKYTPTVDQDTAMVHIRLFNKGLFYHQQSKPLPFTQTYKQVKVPFELAPYMTRPDRLNIEFQVFKYESASMESSGAVLLIDHLSLLDKQSDTPDDPVPPDTTFKPVTHSSHLPNWDFEAWDVRSYDYPSHYAYHSNQMRANQETPYYNVVKTTDAQQGTFALKLSTDNHAENPNFGYILNTDPGEGNPDTWKGGMPLSERPTGIKGYFKYNQTIEDSALIIVSFNKNDQILQTYYIPLKGQHDRYVPFETTFDPPLAETPDHLVLGILSSYALNSPGHEGSILYIDHIELTGVSSQPPLLNGDFEEWSMGEEMNLLSWNIEYWSKHKFERVNGSTPGSYAVQMTTTTEQWEGQELQASNAQLSNGYWSQSLNRDVGGIAYSNTKDTLSICYAYRPNRDDDQAKVILHFFKEGQSIYWDEKVLPASSEFTVLRIPIELYASYMSQIPDSLIVSLISSDWDNRDPSFAGAVLTIDHLYFHSQFYVPEEGIDPLLQQVRNGGFEDWIQRQWIYPTHYGDNSLAEDARHSLNVPLSLKQSTYSTSGSYALELVTTTDQDEIMPGYLINGWVEEDDPSLWHGGQPIDGTPSGLNGFYTFNNAEDTAYVIVAFSKNGSNIHTYAHPLIKTTETYASFAWTFEPALSLEPDSFVLAVVSGNVFSENPKAGSVLRVDNLSFSGLLQQPPTLNGDFEQWSVDQRIDPADWESDWDESTFVRTTEAFEGNYALQMSSVRYYSEELQREVVSARSLYNHSYNKERYFVTGGIPLYSPVDTLCFYYKYRPGNPSNKAFVQLDFILGQGRILYNQSQLLDPTESYQYVEIPFNAQSMSGDPERLLLTFRTSNQNETDLTYADATLTLDNIRLKGVDGLAINLEQTTLESSLYIAPNPADAFVQIYDSEQAFTRIELFNLMGQKVREMHKHASERLLVLDRRQLPSGIYVLKVSNSNKQYTQKLLFK
ncbi:MAG: T9SS type A sorting domain-containing protein [Bacteroidales bacterium]